MKLVRNLVVVCAAAFAATLQAGAQEPEEMGTVLCGAGMFFKTSDEARIAEIFGTENVSQGVVEGWDDRTATIVFANDATQRIAIYWANEAKRSKPASALVRAGDDEANRFAAPVMWQSEGGAQIGQTLEDIEKLYGAAFYISRTTTGGGRMTTPTSMNQRGLASSCKLTLYFTPTAPGAELPAGEGYMSDSPEAKAAQLRLTEFTVTFAR